ncbi:MAG: helix-turn-helix domain-containing protein [Oscillospiraceae bacterium]|nr:helix-turn-helix domain-containing protein [Oscillospiraceae bacterium]
MIADRIKILRQQKAMTQSDLARRLGITRSAINAWELGISVPSTQYIVALAKLFGTTTDYIFGLNATLQIDISELADDEKMLLMGLLNYFEKNRNGEQ